MSLEIFQNEQFCNKEIESFIFIHVQGIDFSGPECNFTAKGSGKVDQHIVHNNNLSHNTSIYNHRTKYC